MGSGRQLERLALHFSPLTTGWHWIGIEGEWEMLGLPMVD